MKTKICTKCKEIKPLSEFYKALTGKDGLRSDCKVCMKSYYQIHYELYKHKIDKRNKKYRQTHKNEFIEYKRQYRKTLTGYIRELFSGIKQRCNNPKDTAYKRYGGRGIKCLFKNADEFLDYILNKLKIDPRGLQIDRINNNGHYEPGNIRIVTAKVNTNNRGNSKK